MDLDARIAAYAEEREGISHEEALRELASAYLDLIDTIRAGGTGIAVAALNAVVERAERNRPWPPPEVMERLWGE